MNKEIVNTGRQRELDWAKTVAIFAMIIIHVYEQMSAVDVEVAPTGAFRLILEFMGGPLAAPIFMFCMGIGIEYSRRNSPKEMVKRGVHLLLLGYLLSFVKGTIPTAIAMSMGFEVPWTLTESLFLVSILQFAGMAFFTIALMKKLRLTLPAMLVIALVLSVIGGFLAKIDLTGSWTQFLFGLFFVTNDVTTFPLFRWLYYPVFGMIFAYFLQRAEDKGKFYRRMFPVALCGTVAFSLIYTALGFDIREMFMLAGRVYYNQSIMHYLFTTFVILTVMPIYYALSVVVKVNFLQAAASYLAKKLNVIYFVQWIFVVYTQSFMIMLGVENLTIPYIVPAGLIMLALSVGTIELFGLIKRLVLKLVKRMPM